MQRFMCIHVFKSCYILLIFVNCMDIIIYHIQFGELIDT